MLFSQQMAVLRACVARRGKTMGFFELNTCRLARRCVHTTWLAVPLICSLVCAQPGFAQKKEKKKKDPSAQGAGDAGSGETVRLPDDRAIDLAITEMLAGWQLGNIELLHKHYADDVTVVSGVWEPPLVGWNNFLKAYQKQHERVRGGRMDRTNTLIQVKGNLAWADYQWEFEAMVDDQQTGARGHTTGCSRSGPTAGSSFTTTLRLWVR